MTDLSPRSGRAKKKPTTEFENLHSLNKIMSSRMVKELVEKKKQKFKGIDYFDSFNTFRQKNK